MTTPTPANPAPLTAEERETFIASYIDAGLFAETDDDENPLDVPTEDRDSYSRDDLTEEARREVEAECDKFIADNLSLLREAEEHGCDLDRSGHNFWLNRRGHGSGFWDEDGLPKDLGRKLSDACKKFNSGPIFMEDDKREKLIYEG
jgi:hypothetical protein